MNALPQPELILGIGSGLFCVGVIFLFLARRESGAFNEAHGSGAATASDTALKRAELIGRFFILAGLTAVIVGIGRLI